MRKALVVGINTYDYVNNLSGCVNDAMAVAEQLESHGDGTPNFDVKLQTDRVMKSDFKLSVDKLFADSAEVALLYYSGHGTNTDTGYIVTSDAAQGDLGVELSYILDKANKSKCKNKIIILDCCYSGQLGFIAGSTADESLLGDGLTIMSASTEEQVAIEQGGHGVFTNLFLQALRGGAADISGRITPASIYAFIDQSLGAWQQRPIFKTNTSSFLSIKNVIPQISKDVLRELPNFFDAPNAEVKLDPSYEYTNDPKEKHEIIEPYAKEENVQKMKKLQLFQSVGLVEPIDEEYMYFAAMHGTGCKLTPLGEHYWHLAKDKRF